MKRLFSLALILLLGFLLGTLGFYQWDKSPIPLEKVQWSTNVHWIAPVESSYRFYARKTFEITELPQTAWLRLSADNDFILYINGQSVVKELSIINNSLGLSRRLTDRQQQLNSTAPYRSLDAPEIFIENAKDWKIAYYTDLTRFLKLGKNAITLEIQHSTLQPRFALEGKVQGASGTVISLDTGVTPWLVYSLGDKRQNIVWNELDFPDYHWQNAKDLGKINESIYSRISSNLVTYPLQGYWISGQESSKGELWFKQEWEVAHLPPRAFLRFAAQGDFSLQINGKIVAHLPNDQSSILHLYNITNLLNKGKNTFLIRLSRSMSQTDTSLQNPPLQIFLNGWTETRNYQIDQTLNSDSQWHTFPNQQNLSIQTVSILDTPAPQQFQRKIEGDAYLFDYPDYLLRQLFWQIGATLLILAIAGTIGYYYFKQKETFWQSIETGSAFLLPSTLFLLEIGLLRHRYADAEPGLIFAQSQSNTFILFAWLTTIILTFFYTSIDKKHIKSPLNLWGLFSLGLLIPLSLILAQLLSLSFLLTILLCIGIIILSFLPLITSSTHWQTQINQCLLWLQSHWHQRGETIILIGITILGFIIRVYLLEFNDLQGDENVSWDAAKGILKTGVPQSSSEIWYTRSPAYHYMLATWLKIFGDSIFTARLLSVLWGTATLVIIFILAKKITKNSVLSLIITAFFMIDPWEIQVSRFIRFYQVMQCMSLLSFWLFIKGFIEQDKRLYQWLFYIVITFTILNQEVTVTLLPCFLLGFIFFYRKIRFPHDWSIFVGASMVMIITIYDILFFGIKCLTPWVALAITTDSIIKPHLLNVTGFISSFFVGFNRMHTIYSFLFFGGFLYFLRKKEGIIIWLFSSIFFNLIVTTILVRQLSYRYVYAIYPLFIILAIYSAVELWGKVGDIYERFLQHRLPLKQIALIYLALLLCFNIEPLRVLSAYHTSIFMRNNEMFEYIKSHRKSGDVVISSSPFGAAIVLGGIDYYLPGTLSFDTLYSHNGRVIDRWAGGVVISNLDQLSRIQEQAQRIWVHLDDHKQNNFPPEMSDYIEKFGQPVQESFATRVRLWQKDDGRLPERIPNSGKDLGTY
jgi:hypothetical protein